MGLLDQFLQTAGEGGTPAAPAQHAALYSEVAKIVAQEGGVPGIAQKFEQNGMGGVFTGLLANPPAAAAPAVPAPDATADPNAAAGAPAPAAAPASPLTGDHIVQLLEPSSAPRVTFRKNRGAGCKLATTRPWSPPCFAA
jgi:hypothetical protein